MTIATLNPWQVLDQLNNDSLRRRTQRAWQPLVDISESDTGYEINMELPGVDPKQVNIEQEDSRLKITGEKTRNQAEDKKYQYCERSTGVFSRTFKLPEDADSHGIEANFQQGLLTITIRKQEQTQPKKIEIKFQ